MICHMKYIPLFPSPHQANPRAGPSIPPNYHWSAAHRKNTVRAMICESYMIYLSEQLSWRPRSMQISCADNPTSQRIEIRKLIQNEPIFLGHCVRLLPTTLYSKVLGRVVLMLRSLRSPRPVVSNNQTSKFTLHPAVMVRLYESLWKVRFSPDDVAIEVLTLCSQLEPL